MAENEYGALAPLVAGVGSLAAAAMAIIVLAWKGRNKWEPELGGVGIAVKRVTAIVVSAGIAILWVRTRGNDPTPWLDGVLITAGSAAFLIFMLYIAIYYTLIFEKDVSTDVERRSTKIVGGFCRTEKANRALRGRERPTTQQIFAGFAYDEDQVWPRGCRAAAHVLVVLTIVLMVASGAISMSAGAILIEREISKAYVGNCDVMVSTRGPEQWRHVRCVDDGTGWPDLTCRSNCGDHERTNGHTKSLRIGLQTGQRIGKSCLPNEAPYACTKLGSSDGCANVRLVSRNSQTDFFEIQLRNWGPPVFLHISHSIEERFFETKESKLTEIGFRQGGQFSVHVPAEVLDASLRCKIGDESITTKLGEDGGRFLRFLNRVQGPNTFTFQYLAR